MCTKNHKLIITKLIGKVAAANITVMIVSVSDFPIQIVTRPELVSKILPDVLQVIKERVLHDKPLFVLS